MRLGTKRATPTANNFANGTAIGPAGAFRRLKPFVCPLVRKVALNAREPDGTKALPAQSKNKNRNPAAYSEGPDRWKSRRIRLPPTRPNDKPACENGQVNSSSCRFCKAQQPRNASRPASFAACAISLAPSSFKRPCNRPPGCPCGAFRLTITTVRFRSSGPAMEHQCRHKRYKWYDLLAPLDRYDLECLLILFSMFRHGWRGRCASALWWAARDETGMCSDYRGRTAALRSIQRWWHRSSRNRKLKSRRRRKNLIDRLPRLRSARIPKLRIDRQN